MPPDQQQEGTTMFEPLLFMAAGLCIGAAAGFAAAWALNGKAREDLAATNARAEEQERSATEKLALVANTESRLSDTFKALSADALNSTSQTFLELATAKLEQFHEGAKTDLDARQKAVDSLVQPIKESLTKVDGKLGEIEKTRLTAYSSLDTQLKALIDSHLPKLHNETANLVKALRQPTTRGRWGEVQLHRVLEMAGMLEHCDFVEQSTATASNQDGRLRPDAIVKLAGGRRIVIDAKVPFTAYLAAAEAATDDERTEHLTQHAALVRAHMTALGRKAYWETFSPSPDFVIMFLPGEMLYSAALQQDPSLIEAGLDEKVVLATPTTLIALLRTVALGWREQALALNAQEVAQLGRQLYDRVASLAAHWSEVGDKLDKAVGAYNKSVATLETRVLVTARKFVELEAAPADAEIEAPSPVETLPRALSAPELAVVREVGGAHERSVRVS
jgi:DNA recombination protein RmuC